MVTGITDSDSARQTMPPKKKNITKTNIYLPNPILRELRLIAVDTPGRMSVNSVIVGILEQYLRDRRTTSDSIDTQLEHHYDLGKSSRPPEIPEEFRPWIARLIYILTEQLVFLPSLIKLLHSEDEMHQHFVDIHVQNVRLPGIVRLQLAPRRAHRVRDDLAELVSQESDHA